MAAAGALRGPGEGSASDVSGAVLDLVFVVVISELSQRLAEHPSWPGVGWFVFLFHAVWSSWINGTLYHDLHTTNDVSVRVFTFGQMLAVALMAVFVGEVPG